MSTGRRTTAPTPASIAEGITSQYGRLQCLECAKHLARALQEAGFRGRILELRGDMKKRGHICMKDDADIPFLMEPGQYSITENGRHFGVEVGTVVYDNIFRRGVARDKWEHKFECYVPLTVKTYANF